MNILNKRELAKYYFFCLRAAYFGHGSVLCVLTILAVTKFTKFFSSFIRVKLDNYFLRTIGVKCQQLPPITPNDAGHDNGASYGNTRSELFFWRMFHAGFPEFT